MEVLPQKKKKKKNYDEHWILEQGLFFLFLKMPNSLGFMDIRSLSQPINTQVVAQSQPQTICEWMAMAVFPQIIFIKTGKLPTGYMVYWPLYLVNDALLMYLQ